MLCSASTLLEDGTRRQRCALSNSAICSDLGWPFKVTLATRHFSRANIYIMELNTTTELNTTIAFKWKCCWRSFTWVSCQFTNRWYEGRSINKLQNGAIPLILKMGKIRNMRFVGNLILKIYTQNFDDDVIIVTSSVHLCIIFSTSFLL